MRCSTDLPRETYRCPPLPSADGGFPVDADLHQMTNDGCPFTPDPARWADPDWRDDTTAGGYEMDTSDGELDDRLWEFGEMADGLSERVRRVLIGPQTEVSLVYRYADRSGNGFIRRVSVTPRVYEAEVNRDAIIGAVQALVRTAPPGWGKIPEGSGAEVRIAGFDLEIVVRR